MTSTWMRRLVLGALGGAVVWTSMGCAQERAPINRVQADALSKHFFVGPSLSDPTDDPEFYMSNRIIDEPYGDGQGFLIQSLGSIARIKWEIDETELIGRLTYDRIANSDYKGTTKTNDGQVVAVFNITSHFDIIRDYNPQTGEELNVVTENTTDRPWYEREYFRVDWSTNKVTDAYDFDIFAQEGIFSGVKYDPLSYYIEDPTDPNAPVFSQDDGYFDVTTKVFATPQTVATPYGTFPYCFFFGNYPAIDCNPAEITVRLAFKAVGDNDYEPTDWNGQRMDAFGWFYVDRYGYDRNYGILDDDWHRFAAKYNIWQQSHIKDNSGNYAQCAVDAWRDKNNNVILYKTDANGAYLTDPQTGLPIVAGPGDKGAPFTKDVVGENVHAMSDGVTEDVCRFTDVNGNVVHAGSRCDEFTNKCDLPLYERKLKTIPWYYGDSAPPDLFDTTAKPLNSWNIAVKRASQLGKVVEANRAGIVIGQANPGTTQSSPQFPTSEADLFADQALGTSKVVPDVFVLCHNPVVAGDDPSCGPVGLHARLGDLRYNIVNIINVPQNPSPWGVMDDADDPVTGEKIVTSVNEWGAVLDLASQSVEDLLRWLNGEISDQQIASGAYLRDWVNASKLGTGSYQPGTLSKQEIQTRLNSIDMTMAKMNGLNATQKAYAPQLRAKLATNNLATSLGPSLDSTFEAQRQAAIGSEWEAQLANGNMLQMAGLDPSTPVAGNDTTLSMASELRGLNPKFTKWVADTRNKALMDRGACMIEQPEPDSLVGMARQAQALFPLPDTNDPNYPALKNKRDQALHQWIREQFHLSVIAHEMGHSMGLRHNFTGSMDPLNYHTEYWQLRTNNGQAHFCTAPGTKFSAGAPLDAYTPHVWTDLPNGGSGPKTASDCIGPRWVDPITDNEVQGLIWKWGSSTVMDYPGDNTQDMNDIGLYDKAAMRFGYADLVDIEKDFTVSNFTAATDQGGNPIDDPSRLVNALDGFGYIFGLPIGGVHYTTYNDKFHLLGDCSQQRDPNVPIDPSNPLSVKCTGSNLDSAALRDMHPVNKLSAYFTGANPTFGDGGVAYFAADAQGHVRHPYMFGSDEFADFGNVSVFRFDAGADPYEQQEFLISTYENRYIFNNFRRDRVTFETYGAVSRTLSRYWDKIQGVAKSLALGVGSGVSTSDPGQLMAHALGASDGLAMFVRALTRPEPGQYIISNNQATCVAPTILGPDSPPQPTAQAAGLFIQQPPASCVPFSVALGSGEGRYLHNDYDYSQGYNWYDYQIQVGTAYEKYFSTFYLLEGYNQFISNTKEDYLDGRYKNLSYATLYPQQVRRLFANLAQNGMGSMAPFMVNQTGTQGQIQHVQYLPWEKYDPNNAATINLDYPAGAILLDPLYSWEEQYRALFWGFFFGRTTLSMDTVDQMRIYSPGGAESLDVPLNQQVHYADPTTGIVYVARNYGTETVNSQLGYPTAKSIGARMIQFANLLATAAYQVTGTDPVTGELTYATDSSGNPLPTTDPNQAAIATELHNFSSNLDLARAMTLFFGYGPPVDPSP